MGFDSSELDKKLEDIRLVDAIIESELQRADITSKRTGYNFESSTHTITVDKDISEDIKTRIRQSAEDKGMTVHFQIS